MYYQAHQLTSQWFNGHVKRGSCIRMRRKSGQAVYQSQPATEILGFEMESRIRTFGYVYKQANHAHFTTTFSALL